MIHIVVFASGTGSNAINLISHFRQHPAIRVKAVFCNRPDAPVIQKVRAEGVPVVVFDRQAFNAPAFVDTLKQHDAHWLVLAGFLWLVPPALIDAFPQRIINIHPALLPAYGGKGMFGHHVHQAVLAAREPKSGITIHLVDHRYDHGDTLFQVTCPVLPDDTADTLASRIHELEHRWFPEVVETCITRGVLHLKTQHAAQTL